MDTTTWEATIGGGTRLSAVTKSLLDNGNRAIAHGTCPDVGIGGHATMGGLGPVSIFWFPVYASHITGSATRCSI